MTRTSRLWRDALVLSGFCTLTIWMTGRLAWNLATAVAYPEDPYLNTWILDWDWYATFHRGVSLFNANIFFPAHRVLAFSENLYGIAIFLFPLRALGVSPLAAHNVAFLAAFALSGFSMYLLARRAVGSRIAAVIAGIFYAYLPYRFVQSTHLQHEWCMWLPALILAVVWLLEQPGIPRAAILAAIFWLNGSANIHWLLFTSVALPLSVALLMAFAPAYRSWRGALLAAMAILVAGLALLPLLLPYRENAREYGMVRDAAETMSHSAMPGDWAIPNPASWYGPLTFDPAVDPERWLFPGLVGIVLGILGLADRSRTSQVAALLVAGAAVVLYLQQAPAARTPLAHRIPALVPPLFIVIGLLFLMVELFRHSEDTTAFNPYLLIALSWVVLGVWGSLGLRSGLHSWLFDHVDAFRAIRIPARWAMIAYTGWGVLVARGVSLLLPGRRAWRCVVAIGVAGLLISEMRLPSRWYLTPTQDAELYSWLARQQGATLELPLLEGDSEYTYLLDATGHHQPLLNGKSGFSPAPHKRLAELFHEEVIGDEFLSLARSLGCERVILHTGRLETRKSVVVAWLQRELQQHRLYLVAVFRGEDFVFSTQPLLATESHDLAGRTPEDELEAFISGKPTYHPATFGWLDVPRESAAIAGPLVVDGWARSPDGIAEVNVKIDNGKARRRAHLGLRPDVEALYPWYPAGNSKFSVTIPRRPSGVSTLADVQIEIVDGRGCVTTLPQHWISWR